MKKHTEEEIQKRASMIESAFSKEGGLFGKVNTFGMRDEEYSYVGYMFTEDIETFLKGLSDEDYYVFGRIFGHFERNGKAYKKIISTPDEPLDKLWSEIAWSNSFLLVMFGILEIATKRLNSISLDGRLNSKGEKMKEFLKNYLTKEEKDKIVCDYKLAHHNQQNQGVSNFDEFFKDIWGEVRSGFIHDIGLSHKRNEGTSFNSKEVDGKPVIELGTDLPIREIGKYFWNAILRSFDYEGELDYERVKDSITTN